MQIGFNGVLPLIALALLGMLAGCQSSTPESRLQHVLELQQKQAKAGRTFGTNPTVDAPSGKASVTDPDASRLQDIGGALLFYYASHERLPSRLDDLQTVVEPDVGLNLASPATGEPYTYVPDGLIAPGKSQRIVIYDPQPTADGARWCLFMPDFRPGAATSINVLAVPDNIFRTYHPASASP